MPSAPLIPFNKPALSTEQHIVLLRQRGLAIPDEKRAAHYLDFIGYYRLGIYCKFFQQPGSTEHRFKCGTEFENVLKLYIFDRELRLLFMDVLERIEVAFRATLSNTMCVNHGPHWYLEAANFQEKFQHKRFIASVRKECGTLENGRTHAFTEHYFKTYSAPELPPSWMVVEAMSLGSWSKVYSMLASKPRRAEIAERFEMHPDYFKRWMHALTLLRNICAHHLLLWNRRFRQRLPEIPLPTGGIIPSEETTKVYAFAVICHILNSKVAPGSDWPQRLHSLLQRYQPLVAYSEMGFPNDWITSRFWK
jgi:abortive infection bacteriophage resistance protein